MNREKEFVKNTLILFIGKFATQFSSFLLIPLFTHYLLTEDYGFVDLLQTYIALFVPVLTLRMDSAVFRFLVDKRDNKDESSIIITNAVLLTTIMSVFAIIVVIVLGLCIRIKYFPYILINLIILMFSNVFLQILRGMGKTRQYSVSSIITGILNLSINSLLIICFKFGANSILISSSIANICVLLYIIIIINLPQYIKFNKYSKEKLKELLGYSLPMIPNALSWWIVNVSDRTIISIFIGAAFNGIYTVSCKFSNLINSIFSIFNISWQETASVHINDKDKDIFFTNIINEVFFMFASISLIINAIIPLFFNFLVGIDYISSYNYIPILLYANMYNILISLFGGIYIALKKTKEIAVTTIVSAVINIVIDLLLVRHIMLYAACLSTLIAYMTMAIYRYVDVKKYINIKLDKNKFMLFNFIYLISSYMYLKNIFYLNIINFIFILIVSIIINKKKITSIFKYIHGKIFT